MDNFAERLLSERQLFLRQADLLNEIKYREFFAATIAKLEKILVIDKRNYGHLSHVLWSGGTQEDIKYYREAIEGGVRVEGDKYKSPKRRSRTDERKACASTALLNKLGIVGPDSLRLFKILFEYTLCDFLNNGDWRLTRKNAAELIQIFKKHFDERPVCMSVEHLSGELRSLLRTPGVSYKSGNLKGKCRNFPALFVTVSSTLPYANRASALMSAVFASALCDFFASIKMEKSLLGTTRLKHDTRNLKYSGLDYTPFQKKEAIRYILSEVARSPEFAGSVLLENLFISEVREICLERCVSNPSSTAFSSTALSSSQSRFRDSSEECQLQDKYGSENAAVISSCATDRPLPNVPISSNLASAYSDIACRGSIGLDQPSSLMQVMSDCVRPVVSSTLSR